MLQFLLGITMTYPIFYGLDRLVGPHLGQALDALGAPGGANNAINAQLDEIHQMEHRLSTQITQTMSDMRTVIAHSSAEAVLRPCINNVVSTWSTVLTLGRMYRVNSYTELDALREGNREVSRDIDTIFSNRNDLLNNTPSIEKTFKLLMNTWRCALSVEMLYLERQTQYGPDTPEPDAESQLKNRYKQYLIDLQKTIVAACIDRLRIGNTAEAISALKSALQLEEFGEVNYSNYRLVTNHNPIVRYDYEDEEEILYNESIIHYRGSYEEELFQFIFNVYVNNDGKNDGIVREQDFIKLLVFIYNLPLVNQQIIAYDLIIIIYQTFNEEHRESHIRSALTNKTTLDVHPNRHTFVLAAFLNHSIEKNESDASEREQVCFNSLKSRLTNGIIHQVFDSTSIFLYVPWTACIIDAGGSGLRGRSYAQRDYDRCFQGEVINPYLLYKREIIFSEENGQPNNVYLRFYNTEDGNYLNGGSNHKKRIPEGAEKDNHHLQWRLTRSHFVRGAWGGLPTFFLQCRATGKYLVARTGEPQLMMACSDTTEDLNEERLERNRERNYSVREVCIFKSPRELPCKPNSLGYSIDCVIS